MTMAETEVAPWLKALPLAPEYHPTEAEFLDPIDYIFKIEHEAAQFGICKIVPPFLKAPKRVVFNNLNLSLADSQDGPPKTSQGSLSRSMCPARSMSGGGLPTSVGLEVEAGGKAKFTTRRQQLGWNARKSRAALPQAVVHKLVWQSGESYTLDQFEAKAKIFSRNRLGTSQEVVPLAVEALFWKAAFEKAISIEYANDIPGSAFAEPREAPPNFKRRWGLDETSATEPGLDNGSGQDEEEKVDLDEEMGSTDEVEAPKGSESASGKVRGIGCKLSNSAWNMRKVARSPGSLLRFIPDEVPGVTSPMVYIGMLFSWFAWHVEDHELHSLNYLHTGASKTWYAVPGEAAPSLEEVVRVHGYGGQLNPRDAFSRLGEKTTVMSPEVLVAAGVPCCRLVQNAGEYVVTFPRAYHLGFSHGFNCGEAANFATPGWLDVAREASVRRAAMNYLPMLSHQQLLYMLAVSLTFRSLFDPASEKRSSRLKEKKRAGEEVVKSMFVNDVIQQNDLIGKLLDIGVAGCIMLGDTKICTPHPPTTIKCSVLPASLDKEHTATCTQEAGKQEGVLKGDAVASPVTVTPIETQILPSSIPVSLASKVASMDHKDNREPCKPSENTNTSSKGALSRNDFVASMLPLDWGTLPCAACGILCYSGMAVVQPSQTAATSFRPLQSHVLGAGRYRAKGLDSSLTGVLPAKADKKSADFHMLPTVGVAPSPELEGTPPDRLTDALYEDQTAEPEVWTPDLKEECPSMKDCSNEATPDAEVPHNGLASAFLGDEDLSCEVMKAVPCDANMGADTNSNCAGDSMEVDKQNNEIVNGLWSLSSVGPIEQPSHATARSTKCEAEISEAQQHTDESVVRSEVQEERVLSSLQLLAVAYDDDSDDDEDDAKEEQEKGDPVDEVTVVGVPSFESVAHLDNAGLSASSPWTHTAHAIERHSSVVTHEQEQQDTSCLPTSKAADSDFPTSAMMEVDRLLQQTDSHSVALGCSKEGPDMQVVVLAQSEGCLDPATRLDTCENLAMVQTSPSNTTPGTSACKFESDGNKRDKILRVDPAGGPSNNSPGTDTDAVLGDDAKQWPVLPLGECVTCSLPHDSFFDSFEELTPKNAEIGKAELAPCAGRTEVTAGCDKDSNLQSLAASQLAADQNDRAACPLPGKANGRSEESSSITGDVGTINPGESVDRCGGSQALGCEIKYPNGSANEDRSGMVESFQMNSKAPNQSEMYKGAARPRVFCLEHAVVAQQRLELIGGAHVVIVCHSSFLNIEQQAKEVAAELGADHQWRSVPFNKAGDEEYSVINAAVEAEEESMPGDRDWVEQLGLSLHGQGSTRFNKIDSPTVNPSREDIGELGSRAVCRGRKPREKKCSVLGQWCGKGWRSDQLHPLLGGCRNMGATQADITAPPPNSGTAGESVSLYDDGRPRKVIRPARLAEYTPDGRAPKSDVESKKSGRKRKTLLDPAIDNSDDEIDDQNSEVTPPRMCVTELAPLADAPVHGRQEDSLWREVPIASTDSFLLPLHLSGAGLVAERGSDYRGRDDTVAFIPEAIFRTERALRHTATHLNACPDGAFHSEASQCCSVVGGFLQRGAKLQALQKLCRQLSTPVSAPCSPLTTPTRVKPSHTKISTAKLVNRLKRKPTAETSLEVKKRKFVKGDESEQHVLSSIQKENSSHLQNDRAEFVDIVLVAENDKFSRNDGGEKIKKEELRVENGSPGENGRGEGVRSNSRTETDNHCEGNDGREEVRRDLEEELQQSHAIDFRPVQGCNDKLLAGHDLSFGENNLHQGGHALLCSAVEDLQETHQQSGHMLPPQTPNLDYSSVSFVCTESLSQGPFNEQAKQEPGLPSVTEVSPPLTEPTVPPRISRVRGRRIRSREWKSCLPSSPVRHEDEDVCQTWEEDQPMGGEGTSDLITLEPTLNTEVCGLGAQADPDYFPYSSCTTSLSTSVRRRRVSTPGMVEWGAGQKGNGEAHRTAVLRADVQHQDTPNKKRKKSKKPSAQKQCEEAEGEFQCDMDGCIMAFDTVRDLQLHKRNLCTWKGCGKHFHMHKYLLQHRRVHLDDRPLKCPWKGCTQAFKWAWARTEHIRVHTGERPYKCTVSGCGQTFRFVSDFSRHKRNTGHRPG